jgi:hypothetical protein
MGVNPTFKETEENAKLKAIALRVFGTTDGIRPLFPRSGEVIQEAMKQAYELGKQDANERR